MTNAIDLHETAISIVFDDLARLWIHLTRSEILFGFEAAALRDAARHLDRALDLLISAHTENSLRFYDERAKERHDRKVIR